MTTSARREPPASATTTGGPLLAAAVLLVALNLRAPIVAVSPVVDASAPTSASPRRSPGS